MSEIYIARSSEIAARVLGGEVMVMSVRDSNFFTLNEVATVIWQAADGKTSLREIVEQTVCGEFEIEPGEAMQDAEQFVNELAQHGILKVSGGPIAAAGAEDTP
jgi:hypothetical protein